MSHNYIRNLFKINTINFWKYKFNLFFNFISSIILPMILNYIFTDAILTNKNLSLKYDLLIYIVISNFILGIVLSDIESYISMDIKSGKFMYKLLSPLSVPFQYFINDFSKKLIKTISFIIPILIVWFCLNYSNINMNNLLLSTLFILIAILIGFNISFLIGILSFWLVEIWGISSVKSLAISIFTGAVIPIDLFPETVRRVLFYLPFPYLSYYPALMISYKGNNNGMNIKMVLLIGILWVLITFLLNNFLWNKGIKKYEGVIE